jgi:hypothetical protein
VFDFSEAILNGITSLCSFSIYSFLEYRKATDFRKSRRNGQISKYTQLSKHEPRCISHLNTSIARYEIEAVIRSLP